MTDTDITAQIAELSEREQAQFDLLMQDFAGNYDAWMQTLSSLYAAHAINLQQQIDKIKEARNEQQYPAR